MNNLSAYLLMAGLLCASSAFAVTKGGGHGGNGGGGVVRDGSYITFGTAGVNIKVTPVVTYLNPIPGLSSIIDFILMLPKPVSQEAILAIVESLIPSGKRKYFNIKDEDLSPRQKKLLIEKYQGLTGLQGKELVLYAVTDPQTQETYLLPDFYKLEKESERMAILYHEALWVHLIQGGAKIDTYQREWYEFVVDSEIKLQKFVEDPQNLDKKVSFMETFSKLFGYKSKYWMLSLAIELDQKSGALGSLIDSKGRIIMDPFFENGFWEAYDNDKYGTFWSRQPTIAKLNLYKLMQMYPRSVFLNKLHELGFSLKTQLNTFLDRMPHSSRIGCFISQESITDIFDIVGGGSAKCEAQINF